MNPETAHYLDHGSAILVAGDATLSMEFPRETRLGGCGHVIRNLVSQGVTVSALCFAGGDDEAKAAREVLEASCRKVSLAVTESAVLHSIDRMYFPDFQALVISGHGRGFCSHDVCRRLIEGCTMANVPVIVDPGEAGWEKYRDATVVSADLALLSESLGKDVPNDDGSIERAGAAALRKFGIGALVVRRGSKGISSVRPGETAHFTGGAREASDVADCAAVLTSVAARLISCGAGVPDAFAAGHAAALWAAARPDFGGISKSGIARAIADTLAGQDNSRVALSYAEAGEIAEGLKQRSKTVVFTNGCFDVLHPGHLSLLRRARRLGDYLIVGLNNDASVKRLKGPTRPINNESTRAQLLSSLRYVDLVVVFSEDTPAELLREVRPDLLVKGSEYTLDQVPGREYAGQTVLLGMVPGLSSTAVIRSIKDS